MTIAYWCVFAMIIFPYFFTVLAKSGDHYNNQNPRDYLQKVTGWRKRADYVQLNCYESTPAFGIAVVIAHLAHANQLAINTLAITFVIARLCYGICYLIDKAMLRTLFWMMGMGCIIGFFCIS